MNLPEELIRDSTLTRKQVESLAIYLDVLSHQITMKQAAVSRPPRPITVGSYHRTVQQARNNIRSSLRTLMIAVWLGFVKPEELGRLLDLTGKRILEVDGEKYGRLTPVIEALISKIVV